MEKYSQFRDRASGIAPFFPVVGHASWVSFSAHLFLFLVRLPIVISACVAYFAVLQWLPLGSFGKKISLWTLLGIPGIWWIDLQIEGVKRGSLAKHQASRLPQPGTIIASSFTCPIDALYLAAIFDPIFTISYPSTTKVRQISLFQAILQAFSAPEFSPGPPKTNLTDVATLLKRYPNRCIVVFPESTTTNGKGILQLSPSLTTAPVKTKVFPVNLRYEPADITTPIPGSYVQFLWNLLRKPTHYIRVRVAESVVVGEVAGKVSVSQQQQQQQDLGSDFSLSNEQQALLFSVGDAMARLGRVKRVGLGVKEKQEFIRMWAKSRRR